MNNYVSSIQFFYNYINALHIQKCAMLGLHSITASVTSVTVMIMNVLKA